MSFQRIPNELRAYPQWVCWRLEDTAGPKPTKIPYAPNTGTLASVNDPSTWSTFDVALASYTQNQYSGIGFVLTENDPYTFIDLDDSEGDAEVYNRQLKVYREFASYSERSPSGKGLHIIVKGHVPSGRRRSRIEMYSSQRYMTMTGEVFSDVPIAERQDLVTVLWQQMGGDAAAMIYDGDAKELYSDADVLQRALGALNGDKFAALLEGNWEKFYPSQSEADFAFIDIIAFYTQNKNQITRLFHSSPLGQRQKAKRPDYVSYMVSKSFDRMLPPVDVDGLRNQLEERLAALRQAQASPVGFSAPLPAVEVAAHTTLDLPKFDYTLPPGLMGEIAQFVHAASPRPVPEIALAASIGLMAGICGRAFNVSGTGLNQYVLLLAPTGTGKEAMASGIDRLLEQVKRTVPAALEFMGPAEIRSDAALLKYLAKSSPCFVSILGEFGLMLKQLSNQNASSHQIGLKKVLLDLYHKSGEGQTLRPTIYSDREKNTEAILSPSFTILGESTPERFYEALDEGMIYEGLLPRFMTIEYRGFRPALNVNHMHAQPSQALVDSVASLAANCLTLMNAQKTINVKLSSDAQKLFDQFNAFVDTQINQAGAELVRHLWNRAHLKSMKLASLIAVGVHPYEPIIMHDVAHWSIALVCHDIRNLLHRFAAGTIGTETAETKQFEEIVRVVREFVTSDYSKMAKYCDNPTLHNDRLIPHSYLTRRLLAVAAFRLDRIGASNSLRRTIQQFIEAGDLREIPRNEVAIKYKTHAKIYAIAHPKTFKL